MRERLWWMRRGESDQVTDDNTLLPLAIETLRVLPPSDPVKVDQIVAAAFARAGELPQSRELPRELPSEKSLIPTARRGSRSLRSLWWQVGVAGVAAALIFGVGFVTGHAVWLQRVTGSASSGVDYLRGRQLWSSASQRDVTSKDASAPQLASMVAGTALQDGAPVATTFRIDAPHARHVAVVGDFNAWNPTATPLARTTPDSSAWTGVVDVTPGRHTYTFLVDGRVVPDPTAVNVRDPDYGVIVSTLVVQGGK